ncbi:MAG: hypothetical protein K6E50_12525 [Lachnospiraceae bacterium]|nr:hypothetical protein [Lachnospiraceae bacterium]
MERGTYLQLMRRADAAAAALIAMIVQLERDRHIGTDGGRRVSVMLLPEMMAYVCSLRETEGEKADDVLTLLLPLLYLEEGEKGVRSAILERKTDFAGGGIPEVYLVLCRFDAMALEYDGGFYRRMRTGDPGRLASCYVDLFRALWMLGGGDPGSEKYAEAERELLLRQEECFLR